MVEDLQDPRRTEPPFLLSEREMLEAWLEFHRTTLLLKCEGLDDAGRKRRAVPTSKLSLHGLVRHLAEVERRWSAAGFVGCCRATVLPRRSGPTRPSRTASSSPSTMPTG